MQFFFALHFQFFKHYLFTVHKIRVCDHTQPWQKFKIELNDREHTKKRNEAKNLRLKGFEEHSMSHWTYNKFTCVSNGLQQIRNRTVFIKSRLCKITGCTHFTHVNMHLVANDAAIYLLSSFVRPFIHTYMASKVRNRHCVTICVHCHSPVRLHCIVFRVNLLGFGSFFLIRALFCELFYWRWLHFDRSHMPFFWRFNFC